MKKHVLIIPLMVALANAAFPQCPITDQQVSTASTTVCDGGSIQISNSQSGVDYYLRKDADNTVVKGPLSGKDGSPLVFSGSAIQNGITYNVFAASVQSAALHFNGADQFVLATNDAAVQTSEGTYEAWINTPDAGSSFRGIVVKQLAASLFLYYNELGTYDWTYGWRGTGIYLNDGLWHHVAVSFQSGVENGTTVYLDGLPVLTTSMTVYAQSESLAIGNGYDTQVDQNFGGDISEVRIWNTARTDQEINDYYMTSLQGTEIGLVSYYQFSDGPGSNLLKDKISGLDGTLTSTMDPATSWTAGPTPFKHPSCNMQLTQKVTPTVKNSATGTDIQKACDSYVWMDGNTYTASNKTATYNFPGAAINGCDSLVTLQLTILRSTIATDRQNACGKFLWIDGNTYTETNNNATYHLTNAAGCDSTVTLNLALTNIVDQGVVASTAALCDSGITTIQTKSSQGSVDYYLRNDSDNTLVDSLPGTSDPLEFKSLQLNATSTFNVYAVTQSVPAYLNFTGNSQYVTMSNTDSIPVGNSNYTIEAWIKPQATGANGMVGWGSWGSTNQVNAFRFNGSSTLINYWWANDLVVNVPDLNDGLWHHVAATFDGTTRSIFVDGTLAGSDQPGGHNVDRADNITIACTLPGEYFIGGMREVRIWNIGKTGAELNAAMNHPLSGTEPGLVAYYTFRETSDPNTLPDLAGGDNTGTLQNMDAQSWMSGSAGCALKLTDKPVVQVNHKKDIDNGVTVQANTIKAMEANASYQWIDCSNNYQSFAGETGKTFTMSQMGSFAVVLTQGACVDTSECVGLITGTEENIFAKSIGVYPNPTSNIVTIDLSNVPGTVTYTITTPEGKTVEEGTLNAGGAHDLLKEEKQGMYFLRLRQDAMTASYKIIKQ